MYLMLDELVCLIDMYMLNLDGALYKQDLLW